MAKLITDWVKVAESGKTIDGRVIESSWLKDAGELYSKDKYTAVITLEHYAPHWAGSFGTVEALKAEEINGIVSLYAKLCPTEQLRLLNQQGQKLFASIKLHEDFQGTGKAYVIQIGVTDSPASVGTQQLEFRVQPGEQVSPGIELPVFTSAPEEHSLINKIKELMFSHPVSQEKEEAMKPEEFKELKDAIIEGFSALSERNLQSFKTFEESMNKTTEVGSVESLQTELNDLKKQFSALTEKLNREVPPTDIYSVENTGPADDYTFTGI